MRLFDLIEFLFVMTIPVVSGWFLYNDIRWSKFNRNSVLYGSVYALVVCIIFLVNSRYGFILNLCNKVEYGIDAKTYVQVIDDAANVDLQSNAIEKALSKRNAELKRIEVENYRGHKMLICVYIGKEIDAKNPLISIINRKQIYLSNFRK